MGRPLVVRRRKTGVGVAPGRERGVSILSNFCAILAVTGASRPEAPIAGLQVAVSQLNVVVRPGWVDRWRSASMPGTQTPDCRLKPVWPPRFMPLRLADVLVATRGMPIKASLMRVTVLDVPQPEATF